ncbi:caspase family protein [Methylopila sp. M107]|uniref:caspase family protein n=1 Tax=Methylopila sp. M107 TaxID=1101190 RepID=UPI00036270F3|nr:caspase family protein [Methylopila sp. M107]
MLNVALAAEELRIELQGERPSSIQNVSAISPDRTLIATSGWNDITLNRAADGRFLRSFPVSSAPERLIFSPDGRQIVSVSLGDGVVVHDVASGKLVSRMNIQSGLGEERQQHYPIVPQDIALSPNGRFAAVVGDALASKATTPGVILDLESGKVVTQLEAVDGSGRPLLELRKTAGNASLSYFNLSSVSFSADGTAVIAGSPRGAVRSWSTTTGRLNPLSLSLGGFVNRILAVDGQKLLVASGDNAVDVVDATKLKILQRYNFKSKLDGAAASAAVTKKRSGLDFDAASRMFVLANPDNRLGIGRLGEKAPAARFALNDWTLNDTVVNAYFSGHPGELIVVSTFGRLLTADLAGRTVNRRPDKASAAFRSAQAGLGLGSYSEAGAELLLAGSPGIFELDHRSGELVTLVKGRLSETGPITRVPNGGFLVGEELFSGTGAISLLSANGEKQKVVPDQTNGAPGDVERIEIKNDRAAYYVRVNYSPDIFHTFRELRQIDLATKSDFLIYKFGDPTDDEPFPYALDPGSGRIYVAHFDRDASSPDGRRLSQKIIFEGKEISVKSLKEDFPNQVGFINRGQKIAIATSSWSAKSGTSLRIYDAKTGEPSGEVNVPEAKIGAAFFSPSDGSVALISSSGEAIHVADGEAGKLEGSLPGCGVALEAVRLSPDGRFIAAAGKGVVCVFDRKTRRLLTRSAVFSDSSWVTVTPEGFFFGSPEGMKNLNVIRGLDVYSIDQVKQELYRPDLVREKLAGDPDGKVREAAARLDLNEILDSGRTPLAIVTSPTDRADLDKETATVEVSVEDRGGGIGRVEWRVNGVTLGVDSRDEAKTAPRADKVIRLKRILALQPGDNRIEVIAYNGRNLIASNSSAVVVRRAPDAQVGLAKPRLHVLAVGVNDYWDSRLNLNYSVADANALAAAFRAAGEKIYGDVNVRIVLNGDVTAANLDSVFSEMGRQIAPQDVFVFYLAGHGKTIDGRYYFLPHDFRYRDNTSVQSSGVDQNRFQRWFAEIPANKSIMLYDTCESGTLTSVRMASRGMAELEAIQKLIWATGRSVLTASTETTDALEGYRGHGVFTYAVLDGLGRGDANQDGVIEVTELAQFVDRSVPEISLKAFGQRQVPQMQLVGSGFPLASTTVVLSDAPEGPAQTARVSKTPTDVVIAPAPLFEAIGTETPTGALQPGTQVTIVETKDGWSLVAKDGKNLGFVEAKSLLKLH